MVRKMKVNEAQMETRIMWTAVISVTCYELYPDASLYNKNMCDWKMKKCFAGSFLFIVYG